MAVEESLFKKPRIANIPKFPIDLLLQKQPQQTSSKKDDEDEPEEPQEKKVFFQELRKEVDQKNILHGFVSNPNALINKKQSFKFENEELSFKYKGRLRKTITKTLNEDALFHEQKLQSLKQQQQYKRVVIKKEPIDSYDFIEQKMETEIVEKEPLPVSFLRESERNLDWDKFLDLQRPSIIENLSKIPPVEYFPNAPLSNIWKDFAKIGIAIECRNPFVKDHEAYWIGTIIYFAGYRALVRFERLEDEQLFNGKSTTFRDYLAWVSFCSSQVKPLGWAWKHKKKFEPGPIVFKSCSSKKYQENLTKFYKKETISEHHRRTIIEEVQKMRTIDHSKPIECFDLKQFHQNRLARISTILGNRIHVMYHDDNGNPQIHKKGHCFNYKSELIHPFGWSHTVGVQLNGNPYDIKNLLKAEDFPQWPSDKIQIEKGMKLETRHPYNLEKIVGAIITKVLNHGHFEIQTRDSQIRYHEKWVYHITSPFVLEWGFGKKHGIQVEFTEKIDRGPTTREPLELNLLPPKKSHRFTPGMKMECVDVINGTYLGPATVEKTAGHLLRVHFDNMSETENNFMWVDAETSDIYPLGYSEMINFDWQGSPHSA